MEFTFLLKKIVSIFLMPLSLGMIGLFTGIIYIYKQKYTHAKVILAFSFIWIFLISYEPIANAMLYTYENRYPALTKVPKNIKYIYVLGNTQHTDNSKPITSQVSNVALVRLNEAIRLYHLLEQKPTIIVSGYAGLFDPTPGAVMQQRLALSLGVKADNIHTEALAKDTQEEAQAAKRYIGNNPFILVTSASHMQRAVTFFEQEGLHPLLAPTNHLAYIKHPNYFGIFSASALQKSHIVWHEILGQLWQKIKGCTS